ncbi:MAG: type II toxin-antitoxin system RelE/ParE family toxin [Euryarchaeota archaeon]|nr:type II toxin-antitoxin system RelE/ParE family toxin [Euryarchaeota archaeon]
MAEIIWTEEAVRWLLDIHDYIAEENSISAQKVINKIYENFEKPYVPTVLYSLGSLNYYE